MRIVDINLIPYEIEVDSTGFKLLKVGIVEGDGVNKGLTKETTMGYYGKSPGNLTSLIQAIAHDKVMSENQKLSLSAFLTKYQDIVGRLTTMIEKVMSKANKT